MRAITNRYSTKWPFWEAGTRILGSTPCAAELPLHPGNFTPGYSGTFSQRFQPSLTGVTLLAERKREMERSHFKFILRVVFPWGRDDSVWGSAPESMRRVRGSVSLFQKKKKRKGN